LTSADELHQWAQQGRDFAVATVVTVCDARAVFATRARFPDADEIVVDWPRRSTRHHDRHPHSPVRAHP